MLFFNLQTIDSLAHKILYPIRRFPLAFLSALIFSIILIVSENVPYGVRMHDANYILANKIAFVCSVGVFLFTALRLISPHIFLKILGVALLIGYFVFLPDNVHTFSSTYMIQYGLILVSLVSLILVAPFLTHSSSNPEFWEWVKHVIYITVLTILFSILLFVVLNFAIEIVTKLFEFERNHRITEQIITFIIGIFGVYFFLSQLNKTPRLMKVKPYNHIETIFTKYILTPLGIIFLLILYGYSIKIIALSQWPKGIISLLSIAFASVAIIVYLFWTPLWSDKNKKYQKFIWMAILLQLLVLATALYLRIEPYGWTESRYILALLGCWFVGISLYFLFIQKASYRWIFISLPLLLMLSQFGPFSASNITQYSQQERLRTLLSQDSHLGEESNLSLRYNISSSIEYLYQHYGTDALMPVLPEIVTQYENRKPQTGDGCEPSIEEHFPAYATKELGFKHINDWQWREIREKPVDIPIRHYTQNKDIYIKGYDWLIPIHYYNHQGFYPREVCPPRLTKLETPINDNPYKISTSSNHLTVERKGQASITIDFSSLIQKLTQSVDTDKDKDKDSIPQFSRLVTSPEALTYLYEDKEIRIKLLFTSLEHNKKNMVMNYNGEILIKNKKDDYVEK